MCFQCLVPAAFSNFANNALIYAQNYLKIFCNAISIETPWCIAVTGFTIRSNWIYRRILAYHKLITIGRIQEVQASVMMFRRFWDTVWQKNTASDASAALFQTTYMYPNSKDLQCIMIFSPVCIHQVTRSACL